MAARKRKIKHDEFTKDKIRTSQLVNRLSDHALGKIELAATQVRAIEILLRKTLPDLSAVDASVEGKMRQYVINGEPLSESEFEHQYGVEAPEGSTNGTGKMPVP